MDIKDLDFIAESALNDVCTGGNPRDTNLEDIKELYKKLLQLNYQRRDFLEIKITV